MIWLSSPSRPVNAAVSGGSEYRGFSVAADPAVSTVYIAGGDSVGDVWVVTPSATTAYSPVFTSAGFEASFTVGTPGSYSLPVSASPAATFSEVGALPPGLSLSPGGVLAGTPAAGSGGLYQIQVTAANGIAPPGTLNVTIPVAEAPAFTSPPQATFKVGTFGSFFVQASGYPQSSFSETGRLPSSVSLIPSGQLAGTPAAGSGGIYKIQITASNGMSATQAFTLTVDQKPTFTSPARAVFTAGVKGRFTITTTGFPAARLTKTGRLPKGLTFTARPHGTATITGTPARSAQGRYVITITAKNSAGQTTTQTLVIRVR